MLSKVEPSGKLRCPISPAGLCPEGGVGKLTLLVFGALIGAVVYAGYCIMPFYYSYWELQNQMKSAIRVADQNTDQEIRQKLIYHIKKQQIPADLSDLTIERFDRRMRIHLPYSEVFYISWNGKDYDLYVFDFVAQAEDDF